MTKCDKVRVSCGYRLVDGACVPVTRYLLFECYEVVPK